MLYGIICVYLLAKAYECNVRYFILHRNVPLRSDVVQFFAVFAAQKICSLNPFLSLSLSLALLPVLFNLPHSSFALLISNVGQILETYPRLLFLVIKRTVGKVG